MEDFKEKRFSQSRTESDLDLVRGGAGYVANPETGKPEFMITDEQYEKARQEMIASLEMTEREHNELITKIYRAEQAKVSETLELGTERADLEKRIAELKKELKAKVEKINSAETKFKKERQLAIANLLMDGVKSNSEEKIEVALEQLKEKYGISFEDNPLAKELLFAWINGDIFASVHSDDKFDKGYITFGDTLSGDTIEYLLPHLKIFIEVGRGKTTGNRCVNLFNKKRKSFCTCGEGGKLEDFLLK